MEGFLEDPGPLLARPSLRAAVVGDSALSECKIDRDALDVTVNCGLCLGEERRIELVPQSWSRTLRWRT